MASHKKRLIIPIFIPFGGCSWRCVFCNQREITGASMPSEGDILRTVKSHLATWRGRGRREIAFYGGTFTALPWDIQERYLKTVYPFVKAGTIDGIRVSTRPDCISWDGVSALREYGVEVIEIGVQSMVDEVLSRSQRGHGSEDTVRAVRIVKESSMEVGLQIMPGLPGDTEETIILTAKRCAGLKPHFVRIYPTMVIRDTQLYEMYRRGEYTPWGLDDMVRVLRKVVGIFKEGGIPVIRLGLQPTDSLLSSMVAGPYHPSLRDLIDSPPTKKTLTPERLTG